MSAIVVTVNSTIEGPSGRPFFFPFLTEDADSLEGLFQILRDRRPIFGWRLVLDRERRPGLPDGFVIVQQVATILALDGVAMIHDWTRGPIREPDA